MSTKTRPSLEALQNAKSRAAILLAELENLIMSAPAPTSASNPRYIEAFNSALCLLVEIAATKKE